MILLLNISRKLLTSVALLYCLLVLMSLSHLFKVSGIRTNNKTRTQQIDPLLHFKESPQQSALRQQRLQRAPVLWSLAKFGGKIFKCSVVSVPLSVPGVYRRFFQWRYCYTTYVFVWKGPPQEVACARLRYADIFSVRRWYIY